MMFRTDGGNTATGAIFEPSTRQRGRAKRRSLQRQHLYVLGETADTSQDLRNFGEGTHLGAKERGLPRNARVHHGVHRGRLAQSETSSV